MIRSRGRKGIQQSGTSVKRPNFNIPQYSCCNFGFLDDNHSSGKTRSGAYGRFFQVTIRGSSRPASRSFSTLLPASWRESGPHGKNLIGSPMRRVRRGTGTWSSPLPSPQINRKLFFSRFRYPPVCNLRLFPLESAVPSPSARRMEPLFHRSSSVPGLFLLD